MVSQSRVRSVRRSEARRGQNGDGLQRLRELLLDDGRWKPLAIAASFIVGVIVVTAAETDRLPYQLGERTEQPIVARVEFARVNQTATDQLIQKARLATPNYYRINTALLSLVDGELRELLTAVSAAESLAVFAAAPDAQRWSLDQRTYDALAALRGDDGAKLFERVLDGLHEAIRGAPLVNQPGTSERGANQSDHAMLVGLKPEERVQRQRLWYVTNPEHVELVAARIAAAPAVPTELRRVIQSVLVRAMSGDADGRRAPQAPYMFDGDRTRAEIAKADRLPQVLDRFQRGSLLMPPGEITAERLALLTAEHDAFLRVRGADPELRSRWLQERSGRMILALAVAVGLVIYVGLFQSRVVEIHTRALALVLLVLVVLLAVRMMDVSGVSAMWTVAPIAMAAAVLTLSYQPRFALGMAALTSLLTTLVMRQSLGLWLIDLAASVVIVFALREVRTRMRLVQVALLTGVASMAAAAGVWLMQVESARLILTESATAGFAAMTGVLLVFVLLPVIERAFRIATPLTLLEWADFSRPLLKQLIQKAPGTWHHSNLLASIAEAAADEIGANGLLVRVGALYHDVGKLSKPEYFVENQQHMQANAHARLTPSMSLLVILGHVKDGLALAREHGLPGVLHRFIAEHHGTTVVRYFHAAAAQKHAARGGDPTDREVDETEYRYPGPKPGSKETAILMLCDGVEGAVRSLQDPIPARIESVVHEVLMSRLMDGQFDECDITLKELTRLEQSIVKSLCAVYHGRIAYPRAAGESGSSAGAAPAAANGSSTGSAVAAPPTPVAQSA